jgi:RimJ/RimL family protein N-acetyltransferase
VRSDPENTTRAIDEDGALIGMIASFTLEGDRELTYWVDPSRWGRGIAFGAVRLFVPDEPQRPLYARAAEHNVGSHRVLERNGFGLGPTAPERTSLNTSTGSTDLRSDR